jgi:eukaryotic-like serine/threonine-protein kinase
MALAPGVRLGPYDVVAPIGKGGMGEVFRARDTRLQRDVAIKVLPDAAGRDADRLARFEREAQVLASLNHPHIATIYGLEDVPAADGAGVPGRALVMELVDGQTLAERLAAGPLPIDEALAAAHDVGVVHRDLKPANVKTTPTGAVKVLDFGLAKLVDPGGSSPVGALSIAPTMTSPALMTGAGVILGTAAYMSPEQARGRPVDGRADVWALGVVLYEMLTGRRPFDGEDVTQVLAAVVRGEPDWTALPRDLPGTIRVYLRRALEKDPAARVQSIGDFRLALSGAFDPPVEWVAAAGTPRTWQLAATLVAGAVIAVAGLAGVGGLSRAPSSEPQMPIRLEVPVRGIEAPFGAVAVAPDGQSVAFAARDARGQSTLWVRHLSSLDLREIPQVRRPTAIAWSRDGRRLAVLSGTADLNTVDLVTGSAQTIRDGVEGRALAGGLAWLGEEILTARILNDESVLLAFPATGGEPRRILTRKDGAIRTPAVTDEGLLLYLVAPAEGPRSLCVAESDGRERGCVPLDAESLGFSDGRLVFSRSSDLFSQAFDPRSIALNGLPTRLVEGVVQTFDRVGSWGVGAASSRAAVLAYYPREAARQEQFHWVDASGRPLGTLGDAGPRQGWDLSLDGQFIATTQLGVPVATVRIRDIRRGTDTPLPRSDQTSLAGDIVWSPDGTRVALRGATRITVQPASGGEARVLADVPRLGGIEQWTPDGQAILVLRTVGTVREAVAIPVAGGEPVVLARSSGLMDEMRVSPDGRWLAYNTDESGRQEVYVLPLPATGERWQVSTSGAVQPRWNPRGGSLFFMSLEGRLMEASFAGSSRPPRIGTPTSLFETGVFPTYNFDHFAVSPDGRFLVRRPVESGGSSALHVIVNWPALLTRPGGEPTP